jgi:hypothetical protein
MIISAPPVERMILSVHAESIILSVGSTKQQSTKAAPENVATMVVAEATVAAVRELTLVAVTTTALTTVTGTAMMTVTVPMVTAARMTATVTVVVATVTVAEKTTINQKWHRKKRQQQFLQALPQSFCWGISI